MSVPARPALGASPRGRRNPKLDRLRHTRVGCISAWAEEPPSDRRSGTRLRVHLRVGGGTRRPHRISVCACGASPRGRRNPQARRAHRQIQRCISAWAEEPVAWTGGPPSDAVHLRVGGGTDPPIRGRETVDGASPRGRRNHGQEVVGPACHRCISAWAEEPARLDRWRARAAVHLRVGGGTSAELSVAARYAGASPRGRRNRSRGADAAELERCISAWAEEPLRPLVRRSARWCAAYRSGCISAWAEEPARRSPP